MEDSIAFVPLDASVDSMACEHSVFRHLGVERAGDKETKVANAARSLAIYPKEAVHTQIPQNQGHSAHRFSRKTDF
jgi:hypothetical protein